MSGEVYITGGLLFLGGLISLGIVYRELRMMNEYDPVFFKVLCSIAFLFSWVGVFILFVTYLIYTLEENGKMEKIEEFFGKFSQKLSTFSIKFFDMIFFVRRENEN